MLTSFLWIAYIIITPRMDVIYALEVLFLHKTKNLKKKFIHLENKLR